MQHAISRLAVSDYFGTQVGYIHSPDPDVSSDQDKIETGWYEFIVLSRSTIDGNFEPKPDPLKYITEPAAYRGYRYSYEPQTIRRDHRRDAVYGYVIDFKGNVNTEIFDKTKPWCMFSVLMIAPDTSQKGVIAPLMCGRAIGRIQVDAFLACSPGMKVIELG